jgi:hypothetical protein
LKKVCWAWPKRNRAAHCYFELARGLKWPMAMPTATTRRAYAPGINQAPPDPLLSDRRRVSDRTRCPVATGHHRHLILLEVSTRRKSPFGFLHISLLLAALLVEPSCSPLRLTTPTAAVDACRRRCRSHHRVVLPANVSGPRGLTQSIT